MNGKMKKPSNFNARYTVVLEHEALNRSEKKKSAWFGTRHFVTFMLFLGMANAYIMRTNMSVAIVAMVNHTAIKNSDHDDFVDTECGVIESNETNHSEADGDFIWETDIQGYVLSSFFYGYVITQIPFGILSKRYGNIYFLGIGMLINSVFGLLVPIAANMGIWWLITVRFIQGLGEGPIVPCTHALLAKWIPPNERSRMGAFVYAGAQFGTVISMPLSGLLAVSEGGWPSIFYVFGAVGTAWCIAFLIFVHEDPESHPKINTEERTYIQKALGSRVGLPIPSIPWRSILKSTPFWAILLAHMGHNYGYETLMTELPTYMKQVLHFSIKDNGFLSALPYLAMWFFSNFISHVADWMLTKPYFTHTSVRKIINGIGQYGPAIALVAASFTGCDRWLTVAILTVGVGLNGGIYSGFKVNHLDISPQFAGILMSFTNCLANLAGLLAPIYAGNIVKGALVQEYPWYKLPASVHKVLVHGSEVAQYALLSIGELTEEAAESNNKNIKAFRRDHTREMSREVTNIDLINRLLLSYYYPSQAKWRIVFVTAAAVYAACCTFYVFFSSGQRQPWDTQEPEKDIKEGEEEPEVVTTRA